MFSFNFSSGYYLLAFQLKALKFFSEIFARKVLHWEFDSPEISSC